MTEPSPNPAHEAAEPEPSLVNGDAMDDSADIVMADSSAAPQQIASPAVVPPSPAQYQAQQLHALELQREMQLQQQLQAQSQAQAQAQQQQQPAATPTPTPAPAPAPAPVSSRNSPHPSTQQVPTQPIPHGSSTRVYLNQNVTPHLLEAMKHLATTEPEKPLKWLSEFLAMKSAEIEGP
ncbi:hypothetical protein IQ07DRAFT_676007 [Pyrenochaeta sp. DS3sAY3a]|nr:hypothetical protein IQ07DRAFT_676007 [Pyrenochaeta sp. DS3sAY3a]